MSFPENLKFLRESHNHTQKELSDLLGVQKSCVSNYETGRSYPKRSILLKISRLYNVPLDSLLGSDPYAKASTPNTSNYTSVKKIFVYKNFDDCFSLESPSALYCMSIPAELIGTGDYKAFIADGSIVIIDLEKTPQPGDSVFAYTSEGKTLYGKYYQKDEGSAIISKFIDGKEETSIFDVKNDKIKVLAVAVKTFSNLKD